LWSRIRIDGLKRGEKAFKIDNIDQVYIGHSVVEECSAFENLNFIDTGACYLKTESAKLSLVQIHPYVQSFKKFTSAQFGE